MRYKTVYKYWRTDKNLWEEKRLFMGYIPYYVYTVRKNGITISFIQLFKFPNPKYMKSADANLIAKSGNDKDNLFMEELAR